MMNSNLKVKDRLTSEQGKLLQCMPDGRVRVLMDSGNIREYQPGDLIGTIESFDEGKQDTIHERVHEKSHATIRETSLTHQ